VNVVLILHVASSTNSHSEQLYQSSPICIISLRNGHPQKKMKQ